jgi:hypothetical protein
VWITEEVDGLREGGLCVRSIHVAHMIDDIDLDALLRTPIDEEGILESGRRLDTSWNQVSVNTP